MTVLATVAFWSPWLQKTLHMTQGERRLFELSFSPKASQDRSKWEAILTTRGPANRQDSAYGTESPVSCTLKGTAQQSSLTFPLKGGNV